MRQFNTHWFGIVLLVTGGLIAGSAALGGQQVSAQPLLTAQPILLSQLSAKPAPMQTAALGDRIKGAVEKGKAAVQAPCGGENQRPCVTGCSSGFLLNATGDQKCHACGKENQWPCPVGCSKGFILNATGDKKCHACGAENQPACAPGGCNTGLSASRDGMCRAACGAENQPPCMVGGCDRGFILNATGDKKCHACGAENQPACAPGGCNSGLSASRDGMCRAACGAENQPPCMVGGCNRGFILNATGDKKCHACGAENQSPCLAGGCSDGFILNATGDKKCHACGGENKQPCRPMARLGGVIDDLQTCNAPADNKGCPFMGPGGNVELFSRCMGPRGRLTNEPTFVGNAACDAVLEIQELPAKLEGAREEARRRIDDRIDTIIGNVEGTKFGQTLAELKEIADEIKQEFMAFSNDPECGREDVYEGFKGFFGNLQVSSGGFSGFSDRRVQVNREWTITLEEEKKVKRVPDHPTVTDQRNGISGWIATIADDLGESLQIISTADAAPGCGKAGEPPCTNRGCKSGLVINGVTGLCEVAAACGGAGEPACGSGACNQGLTFDGATGLCEVAAACGGAGEPACGTGACNGFLVYDETTGNCIASVCGGLNQKVCTTVPICNFRLVEDAAVCGPISLNPLYRSVKICSAGVVIAGTGTVAAVFGVAEMIATSPTVVGPVVGGVITVVGALSAAGGIVAAGAGCGDTRGMWRTDKDKYKFAYSERRKLDRSDRRDARRAERREGRQARWGLGDRGTESAAADGGTSVQTRDDPDMVRFGENVDLLLSCYGKLDNLTKSLSGDVAEGAQEIKDILIDVAALEETVANIRQAGENVRQAAHERAEARRKVFRAAASGLYRDILGVSYGEPARAVTTGPQLVKQVNNNQINNLRGSLDELKTAVVNMPADAVSDFGDTLGGLQEEVNAARKRAETIRPRLESGLNKLRKYRTNKKVAAK